MKVAFPPVYQHKTYELTTSEGITLDVLVYCGKGMYYAEDDQYDQNESPVELMRNFLNRGHVLYTDNFYTSPNLAKCLLNNETYLCGTIRNNRKNYSKEIRNVPLQKIEATFFVGECKDDEENVDAKIPTQKILAFKFRARQDKANHKLEIVFMLSTLHNSAMVETGKTDKDGNPITKPAMIKAYNQHMDKKDQNTERRRRENRVHVRRLPIGSWTAPK